jgi:RNA polymerase sigma factor (sigma-70 family)
MSERTVPVLLARSLRKVRGAASTPNDGRNLFLMREDSGQVRRELIETIYSAHYERLLRFAYLLTGGRDAEDLVQDTVVKALRHWNPDAPIEAFGAWAQKTLLRQFLNRLRRARYERRALAVLAAEDMPVPSPESSADVLAALASLPPRQRAAIVLRYFEDLPEAQIADRMSCRPGTVKALLHQGRARLKIVMSD